MRIELSVIEKIEQYLMGTLSENERADFESQLNQNSQLKTQVDVQSQIMEGVQRLALKNATQKAYKSYKLKSFLTKALVIGIIAAAATYGVIKFVEDKEETPTPTEYNETQTQIIFPENDSLSTDANQYLDQEIFRIKTDHDTIIETKDGIVVYIPADAFDTSEPVVDFLVQGAVKTEDILTAGLSTITTDGQELETGGMFYVDAFVNGKRVDLKKELTVDVPSGEPKNGMQLYEGEKNLDGEIVWNNPKPLESFLNPVEITTLDFYPPDYEASLNKMGYSEKAFMDSLYYSFACEENQEVKEETGCGNIMVPRRILTVKEWEFIYGNSERKERFMTKKEAKILCEAGRIWESSDKELGQRVLQMYGCTSCHSATKDGTGPALQNVYYRWVENSSDKNFYAFVRDSRSVINSGDRYAIDLDRRWESECPPSSLTNEDINIFLYYLESFTTVDASKEKTTVSNTIDSIGNYTSTSQNLPNCQGINPASIKTIWNSEFNKTNLATKEFEERMPWIHKTCDNKILELYINNLDKKLSTVDSMAFKYLSGELREKFKEFAARGDGRVELDNQVSKKLSAYYEKQRNAIAKALVETQQNYWNQQYEADAKNNQAQTQSENRNLENTTDVFQKEYKKNLCKVFDELQLSKDCNAPTPANAVTVQISDLGWKNIDRLVSEATAARETTSFSASGKTSTLTYTKWSATISDFEKYDRINVYNIPIEFNSYVKLNGTSGNYVYKLNADLTYQTVVLAWTADGIYFYKADAVTGNSTITLKKVSDEEWRNEIKNSLNSIANMNSELDHTEFMQKDQKRINANKEKTLLRQKIEPVVFPCGGVVYEMADTTAIMQE
jgi:cytochrome c551/c552